MKIGLRRMFCMKNPFLIHCGMHLIWSSLFCLPIHWWWKWFKRSVEEKHFCQHNLSHSAWPWQWEANNLDKTESSSKICTCEVSTQQWPSTQMTRRCDDNVQSDKKRVNSCVLKYLFWRELSNQKIANKPRKCLSDAWLV
jgi:hypothetical protein